MRIVEELSDLAQEQAQDRQIQANVEYYILDSLEQMESQKRKPQLILDTLIDKISEYHNIKPRRTIKIINKIVENDSNLRNNQTVLFFKYYAIKCKCGCKQSSKFEKCLSCGGDMSEFM